MPDTSSVGGDTVVYALTMYGEYGFENDTFVKVAGSGTIPGGYDLRIFKGLRLSA